MQLFVDMIPKFEYTWNVHWNSPEEYEPLIMQGKLTRRSVKKSNIPIPAYNRIYNHLSDNGVHCRLKL